MSGPGGTANGRYVRGKAGQGVGVALPLLLQVLDGLLVVLVDLLGHLELGLGQLQVLGHGRPAVVAVEGRRSDPEGQHPVDDGAVGVNLAEEGRDGLRLYTPV